MKKRILRYLRNHCPSQPHKVDRLLISAFLTKNSIHVKKNRLLKHYVIKPEDRDYSKLQGLIAEIDAEGIALNFEDLIKLFEFVVSPEDRVVTGAVYTPIHIREYILNQSLRSEHTALHKIRLADISCGCGGFLYSAARRIRIETNLDYATIFKNCLYGLDIQSYSVSRTKLLMSLLAVSDGEDIAEFSFNVYVGDALKFKWDNFIKSFSGFDVIVGNPPYVCSRNISESTKKALKNWSVCETGHPDLYIPFIQIGLENLRTGGFLGFITMNTFFKSVNGRGIRAYLQEKSYKLKILDFGSTQIFESKSTYACVLLIEKVYSNSIKYILDEDVKLPYNKSFSIVKYSSLVAKNGWNLQQADLLLKIESAGTPFGDLYTTRNGIATLKNHIYIFSPIDEDRHYYYLQNGSVFPIEKEICRDIINPNRLVQIDDIDKLREKAIFPYRFNGKKTEVMNERFLRTSFPKAFKYLEAKKQILATRDKGRRTYEEWFAYGRNQSIEKIKYKLFFPHITPSTPNFIANADDELLFYNGIAVVTENLEELQFLDKLMSSRLFWFYIKNSSKPYGSGYYSLSRNYIKGFGVFNFSQREKRFIVEQTKMDVVNDFIESKYGMSLR